MNKKERAQLREQMMREIRELDMYRNFFESPEFEAWIESGAEKKEEVRASKVRTGPSESLPSSVSALPKDHWTK